MSSFDLKGAARGLGVQGGQNARTLHDVANKAAGFTPLGMVVNSLKAGKVSPEALAAGEAITAAAKAVKAHAEQTVAGQYLAGLVEGVSTPR